jgi:hypothetical protein
MWDRRSHSKKIYLCAKLIKQVDEKTINISYQ